MLQIIVFYHIRMDVELECLILAEFYIINKKYIESLNTGPFHMRNWLHSTILLVLHVSNIYSRSTGRVGGRQGTITNNFLWPRLTRHIFILWPPFYAE